MRTFALILALFLSACQAPPDAEPIRSALNVTYTNDYGVITVAGMTYCGGGDCPEAIYWRSDNTCQVSYLGTIGAGGHLTNDITLNAGTMGGAGWGNIAVLGSGQNAYLQCNNLSPTPIHLTSLEENSYYVTVNGTPAADYINCSGHNGHTICNGLDGNDIMEVYGNRQIFMHGGSGNDKLRIMTIPSGNWTPLMYGDDGDDCIYTPTFPTTVDCGWGNDSSNVNGYSCENVSGTTCP